MGQYLWFAIWGDQHPAIFCTSYCSYWGVSIDRCWTCSFPFGEQVQSSRIGLQWVSLRSLSPYVRICEKTWCKNPGFNMFQPHGFPAAPGDARIAAASDAAAGWWWGPDFIGILEAITRPKDMLWPVLLLGKFKRLPSGKWTCWTLKITNF